MVVVKDPDRRRRLRDLYLPGWYEYVAMRELFAGAIGTSGATYSAVEGINAVTTAIGGA